MKHVIKNGDLFKDDTHACIVIDADDVDSTVLIRFTCAGYNYYWIRTELNDYWLDNYKYCGNSGVDINNVVGDVNG